MDLASHLCTSDDPALDFAKREKVVLTLGLDPAITGKAHEASRLYLAWLDAERKLEEHKDRFRKYAIDKRNFWNEANDDKVKTLKIPFMLRTERGIETRHISVSCTATYTVDQLLLRKLRTDHLETFNNLFETKEETVVRPRGKEMLRQHLRSAGMTNPKIEKILEDVFETEETIRPIEDYEYLLEDEVRNNPMAKRLCELAVRRANPTVTFEVK